MEIQGTNLPSNLQFQLQAILIATILTLFFKNSNTEMFNPSHENFLTVKSKEYSFPTTSKGDGVCTLNEMEDEQWVMVEKTGTQFLVKGLPFFVNGFNTYWLMVFAADHSTRGKISEVFRQAAAVGLNVCRTWAFNDAGWRALQISPSVYDEEVFKGLDFVVSEARSHHIRLILSFCNNWEDYGGKAQYVKWGREAGLNLTSDDEFFMDPTIKGYCKAHVERVLTRINTFTNVKYKDDPTIFAWELINEPRCLLDPSGDTLQTWIEEMAQFVKSVDPIHLLEIGVEGFYGPSTPGKLQQNPNSYMGEVGTDFMRNHQTPGIDFASVHIYSDTWLPDSFSDEHFDFVESWMQDHMDDAEKLLNMPVVFGEFGVSLKDERFTTEFREAFIGRVHKMLLMSKKRGGSGGGSLLWQLFPEGIEHMDDGYAVVLAKSPTTSNVLSLHATKLRKANSKSPWKNVSSEDDDLSHDEL